MPSLNHFRSATKGRSGLGGGVIQSLYERRAIPPGTRSTGYPAQNLIKAMHAMAESVSASAPAAPSAEGSTVTFQASVEVVFGLQ